MRVRLSTNPPLPALKAWFPLHNQTSTIYTFKSLLCTSLAAVRGISPSSLHLAVDGFELLDQSELTVIRDGDLISIGLREPDRVEEPVAPRATSAASRKRKRHVSASTSSGSGSESDIEESCSESESSESETSDSGSGSDSDGTTAKVDPPNRRHIVAARSADLLRTVPPGYGKPQTHARNRRRRLKRMHEHEAAGASGGGPVSGANAVAPDADASFPTADGDPHAPPTLMSLSLRNKNKAKNFKSLMNKPLPAKIIFDDQEGASTTVAKKTQTLPRLIPPSSRSSLPENLFVTSVDVEAEDELESSESEMEIDKLESHANQNWATLEKLTREKDPAPGTLVGYKAFGVDPVTCTPGHVLTVARVVSHDVAVLVVQPIRSVSFLAEADTEHPWEEIECGDWRLL